MAGSSDHLEWGTLALRQGRQHLIEDLQHLRLGILDRKSFLSGYREVTNPVEVRVSRLVPDSKRVSRARLCLDPALFTKPELRDDGVLGDAAFGMQRRILAQVRRTKNLQVDLGKNQIQRLQLSGDIGTGLVGSAVTGTATVPTATTWTGAAASFPTAGSSAGNTGSQGHLLFVANAVTSSAFTNPVVGVIVSNTATVATVDQWYVLPLTGGVGTTPSANSAGLVIPGGSICNWIGLVTNASAAAAADILRTADGLFGDGTGSGAATEQTGSGLARTYVAPTFPATKQIQFQNTWTYTGATLVTIHKVVLCNSKAVAGSLMLLETVLSADASVNANGDNMQVTWTITE